MPLALSLEAALRPWIRGPLQLQHPYRSFLDRQRDVIARARGAFLSRWFGSPLPLEGLSVRVAFANLAELAARARAVAMPGQTTPWDRPNLTEPLAGMAGTVAGMWANPLNSLLLGSMITAAYPRWWSVLIFGVNAITAGALGMAALAVAAVGGGGLLVLAGLAGSDVGPLVGLLGSVASLAEPAVDLWDQLRGPRTKVRNPVLREMLAVLDSLAELVPHLFGAAAILITQALPRLPTVVALSEYGRAVVDAVGDAIRGMAKTLQEWFGPKSPLASIEPVIGAAGDSLGRFAELEHAAWSYLQVAVASVVGEAEGAVSGWITEVGPTAAQILDPIVRPFKAASQATSEVVKIVSRAFGGPPGLLTSAARAAFTSLVTTGLVLPPKPWPSLPDFSEFSAILAPFARPPGGAGPRELPPDLEAALTRLAQPSHLLGDALAKPEAQHEGAGGHPAVTSVGDLATYLEMARRLVPRELAEPFADLQHRIADLPVRAAPSTQQLRLRVGALRVCVPEAQAATSRAWSTRLRRAMQAHTVTVASAAAAAGPR